MKDINLVGQVGVARMMLVGGPMDGETRVAVVGAPICVKRKVPKAKAAPVSGSSLWFTVYTTSTDTEGEGWKEGDAKRTKPNVQYAVYLPDVVDGKATGVLRFVGMTEFAPE